MKLCNKVYIRSSVVNPNSVPAEVEMKSIWLEERQNVIVISLEQLREMWDKAETGG